MAFFKIRFINTPGIVSALIDWEGNSLWDHVEIETDTGTYIGAHAGGGIEERPANYCTPSRERRYSIPCSQAQLDLIMAKARSRIGTQYNLADIVGLAIHNRHFDDKQREICSEFTMECAEAGNLFLLNVEREFFFLVTPEMVHLSPLLRGNLSYAFPQ